MHIEYTAEQAAIQPRLASANINPETFLATDYLNHFNEIVMLLEMIPDMPELAEDAADWAPKSYTQHFLDSGFQAKELAVQAYNLAPDKVRVQFEVICAELDKLIQGTLAGMAAVNVAERGFTAQAQELIRLRVEAIQGLLMKLNQVIHGKVEGDIELPEEVDEDSAQTQEDIDKLFD
ncbi:hypothetical protein [Kordiimonas aestuarii]|uniref:hypothetical protein n=1 Tax=Kordiimonas aestuarii TaxID=1005925 RepID=UPI0021D02F27|nr:hypothetical protein [Kordiimonas aestuarii]